MNRNYTELAIDDISTSKIAELAKAGNMAARKALVDRRNSAEQIASLESFRLVAGKETMDKLFDSIVRLTSLIASIPVVAKVGIAKQIDSEELEALATQGKE